jgi:hypothetical protein
VPPLFDLSVDYNEFGPISGIVLALLMMLLVFSFARQHENLYLCAFKVRRLCRGDETLPLPSDAIRAGDYYVMRDGSRALMARYLFRAVRRRAGRGDDVVYGEPRITTNVVENGKWTAAVELPYRRTKRIEAKWRAEQAAKKQGVVPAESATLPIRVPPDKIPLCEPSPP